MDGIGTEPREDADCRSEAGRSQSGFSGLHVPIRSGPARPTVSLSECGSIEEVPEERTGDAAGYDQQPVLFQADSRSHQGPQPESRGLGCLLSVRLSKSSFSAVSIPTCKNVCGFISIAAVNVLIVR